MSQCLQEFVLLLPVAGRQDAANVLLGCIICAHTLFQVAGLGIPLEDGNSKGPL